ncbi:MAG: site-specific integrase [Bacilli bacterium]|jgi:integrase|nr:site-specific integrase [Bacilli bacterium]
MAVRLLEEKKWTKDGRKYIWYVWETGLDGKKHKKFSKAYKTEAEAKRAEKEYLKMSEVFEGDMNMTFKELYTKYYEVQKDIVRYSTLKTYRDRIKYIGMFDKVKLKDMDAIHYQKWRAEMMKVDISNSYKNEIQKFLKIVINWAVKTYGFNMNKFYGRMEPFTSASDIKKEMDFYTLEEFNQFISSAPNLQIKCMYETLYYCGLRRGEARGLQWKDVNWNDKRLSVTKQAVTHGSENSSHYELTKPKTQKSNRILPIAEILFRDLKQLYKEQKQFAEFNDDWFIFGNFVPITFYQMRHKNIEIARDANIKRIRLHDFRHSCASLLINNNANIAVVSQFLGHASIEETLDTYTHMFKDKLECVVNTINKLTCPEPTIVDFGS